MWAPVAASDATRTRWQLSQEIRRIICARRACILAAGGAKEHSDRNEASGVCSGCLCGSAASMLNAGRCQTGRVSSAIIACRLDAVHYSRANNIGMGRATKMRSNLWGAGVHHVTPLPLRGVCGVSSFVYVEECPESGCMYAVCSCVGRCIRRVFFCLCARVSRIRIHLCSVQLWLVCLMSVDVC